MTVKISELTAVVTPSNADVMPVVNGGSTKKLTITQLRAQVMPVSLTADVTGSLPGTNMAAATGASSGSMSGSDKSKLDGIQKQGSAVAISALDIDWTLGSVFTKSLAGGGNTFTFSNQASGMVIVVRLTSSGGGSTVTWPTVKWAGGVAPTQTSTGTDVYTFVHDGTDIYGSVVQAMA